MKYFRTLESKQFFREHPNDSDKPQDIDSKKCAKDSDRAIDVDHQKNFQLLR